MLAREPEVLVFTAPEAAHAHWSVGFVHRRNGRGGHVVHELPELRSSIQIMLGDDYWLRGRSDSDEWERVPRIAFWGPRLNWGYGFARDVIHAFGIGLAPSTVTALTGQSPAQFVDRVVDLASLRADIADELARILAASEPEAWQREVSVMLSQAVEKAGGAPRRAEDVGPRQLRRRFVLEHGFSPRQYRRVLRTDRMLKRLHPKPWEADSSDIAPDFADQPHMIREFKALTGVTPGAYVRSKRAHSDATLRSVIAESVPPPPLA